jgi:hypothetical protein
MPLFIGVSFLFLFDFDGMAIGVIYQNGVVIASLSASESSFTEDLLSLYVFRS